jgi:hypothetical protein
VIIVATLLDPIVIVLMLGLSAVFRKSIWPLIVGALVITAAAVAMRASSNPLINLGCAAFWGGVGYSVFQQRVADTKNESGDVDQPE